MKSINYIKVFYIVLMLSFIQIVNAQFSSKVYKTGNFIFCGKEIPKNFSYLIEKKTAENKWKTVAELKAPTSEAECKAAIMKLPAVVAAITPVETSVIGFVWKRIQESALIDSLYAYSADPRYQYMARTAWFDDGIKEAGNYSYRIKKLSKNGTVSVVNEVSLTFPDTRKIPAVTPVRFRLNEKSISISYKIPETENIRGVQLSRSPYLRNSFSEVPADLIYTSENGEMVAMLNDDNVMKGMTYSYIARPYDGLGNLGASTDTLNIYFVAKPADIGMITNFTVTPDPENEGNRLKWNFNFGMNVNTVDVYRSDTYNGRYRMLAALSPKQKEYFDNLDINPAVTYFYYVSINNGYGSSLPSARIPAILEGKNPNLFPPQDLTATRNGNVVTLNFRRLGSDVRGYYAYRGDGYTAPLAQLPRMLLSNDSLLTYTDTLPNSIQPEVYSYAVSSVNTSYNISPMSERVNISFSGGKLPVPENVNAMLSGDKVIVTWTDAASLNASVASYNIFRKSMLNDKIESEEALIATTSFMYNSFTDSLLLPGRYYAYRVQCVGEDGIETGSISQPASILYEGNPLLQPGNVMAIPSGDRIILKWTMPVDENLVSALVYRSTENSELVLLTETNAKTEIYEDASAVSGIMYYYFITLKYKNNLTSPPTDAVGGKL